MSRNIEKKLCLKTSTYREKLLAIYINDVTESPGQLSDLRATGQRLKIVEHERLKQRLKLLICYSYSQLNIENINIAFEFAEINTKTLKNKSHLILDNSTIHSYNNKSNHK